MAGVLAPLFRGYAGITDWINVVTEFGADKTGAADSSPALTAAAASLPAAGGVLYLPTGSYKLDSTVIAKLANTQTAVTQGDGSFATILNFYGTGDCIRMYNPASQPGGSSGALYSSCSGLRGLTIDGTHSGNGSTGFHGGDIQALQLSDVIIQNFSGTGSIGLHFDNTVSWTEGANVRANLTNCTSHVVFEVTTGWPSFAYGVWDFMIAAFPGQDCVVLKNGAYLYNGCLRMRGGCTASAVPQSSATLRLTGAAPVGTPGAGTASGLQYERIEIQLEIGTDTYYPQTVYLDSGTYIANCYGVMSWAPGGTFAPSNFEILTSTNAYQFQAFTGIIAGDLNLNPGGASPGSAWTVGGPVVMSQGACPNYGGAIAYPDMVAADFFDIGTLAQNLTVGLNSASYLAQQGCQRKTFRAKQAASGGPYTLTWPHNASPGLTTPTVLWAGGSAPVMSTGAGAVDVYNLTTFDGITWYGMAVQNVS